MSDQIEKQRNNYYNILEQTQKGSLDVTIWLRWYLECMTDALKDTEEILSRVLSKAKFWNQQSVLQLNDRQNMMVNKILDDFEGRLTSAKWAKMCKCSHDTALRDIQDLIDKRVLKKEAAGGRSTHYVIREAGDSKPPHNST